MNFIKRALLSVTKRKIKTLILIVILCVIANMILAGLSIQSATVKSSEFARKKLGGAVTLEIDFQKAMSKSGNQMTPLDMPQLTIKDIDKLKDLKHVKAYNYISNGMALADNIKPVISEKTDKKDNKNVGFISSAASGVGAQPDISLEGDLYTELSSDFAEGKSKLIDGRHLTKSDQGKEVAVIEKNLAEKNKLKVGDKIKLKGLDEKNTTELEVVGIYEATNFESNPMMDSLSFLSPYNKIYVPNSAIAAFTPSNLPSNKSDSITKAIYYMDDPLNIDKFKADVNASGIKLDNYKLDAKDSLYKQMVGPMENVGSFSQKFIILVAIAGAVILSLIIILSLKDRRYDIGVLMSIGESRVKIISQFLVEIIIIACIAFSISTYTGNMLAQKIGDNLLQKELKIDSEQKDLQSPVSGMITIGPGENFQQKADPIDKIDVSTNWTDLKKLYLIGFALVILATTFPTIAIVRFNPKTILSRND